MKSKIQLRMFFLIFIISVVFIAGVILFRITENKKITTLLISEKANQTQLTQSAIEILSKSCETFAYDYSFWDEMISFTKTRDPKWAKINVDVSLATFKTTVMWIYDPQLNLIYSKNDQEESELTEVPVDKSKLKEEITKSYFVHFYAKSKIGIIEIFGAPIQPSNDISRKTTPRGFVFTGKLLGSEYLKQLSLLTATNAQISGNEFQKDSVKEEEFNIICIKDLHELDNRHIGKIITQKKQLAYENISKEATQQLYIIVLFSLVVLASISGFFNYIINKPLKQISKSLIEGNVTSLEKLQNKRNEFGQIASLIIRFFNQKSLLTLGINERIKIEEELQQTKANLEILVEQRTEQLLRVNNQLAEDIALRKKIEAEMLIEQESSRLKSTLLLNLNHEFRTPLTGILGSASILKELVANSLEVTFIDGIITSGNRLLRTFNSFLALSELELGNKELLGNTVNLNQVVSQVVEKMATEAEVKGLGIKVISMNDLYIPGDEYFLKLTIINILDNAIKYTNKGEIRITLKSELVKGTLMSKLEIADTGIGISKESINFIFHEFRQVSEGIGRRFEGNGLGLTIAKKIVVAMNGEITVSSQVNRGSVFIILLPLSNIEKKNDEIPFDNSGQLTEIEKYSQSHSPAKVPDVLLVEDNFINAEVIANFLTGRFTLDHAYNGASAVEMAQKKNYDIILMDINLGEGINGVEACQEIRKTERYKDTPIVAVTGYSILEEKENLLASGLSDYLSKPFDKKELLDLIYSLL